jgi:hypothetical protein
MVKLWAFGWLQLIISAVADPIMLIWSFFSVGALINVIVYDVLVLGISFDDALNYDPNYTIEAEYNGYQDAKVVKIDFGEDDDEIIKDDVTPSDDIDNDTTPDTTPSEDENP